MAHYLKNLSRARRRAARSIDIRRSVSGRRFSAEALERRRLLTAITWTGTFDHTNWNQPGNWSTNTVPTAADDVTINTANTIQSNSTQAVHNLTFNNGTIAGSGELDVGGAFHWVNGTLDTGGKTVVVNTGSLAFDPGNHELNRELDLNGPATWTSGNIGLSGGTIVNNSTFTATPGTGQTLQMFGNGGGVNAFNNQGGGAFIVSGPGTVRVFFLNNALPFNNTSSVEVQSGTLQISSGGTSSGSLIADAGATLAFPFDYTFAAGSSASGAGSFQFTGGTQTLTADQTFPNLTLNNPIGMEVGPGSLTVTGPFHWISGTLGSGTKTIVPATGSLTLDTGNHQLEGELDLNGPATWTAGNIALFGGTIVNNATFTAAAATSQTLQMFGNGGGANAFNNQGGGSFVANGPGTVRVFFLNNALPFNNAGSVSVQAGTLQISSGGMSTGGFTVAAGATLAFPFDYTFASGSSFSGVGSFQFTGGTQTLTADQTFPNLTLNNPIGMEVGPGSLTVGGPFQWISGTLVAKTIVPATGSLTLDTGNHQVEGELDLNGPATWTAGNIALFGGTIVNNATFTATAPAGTLQMFGNGGGVNAFNNQGGGSFVANGPGTVRVFFLNNALPFNNAGSVSVQAGTLQISSGGMSTGGFTVAAGATLAFPFDYTFAAGSSASGAGSFQFTGGTQTLSADQTFPNLTLNNPIGMEVGPGSLTVGGPFQWISGTLVAKTIVPATGSLTLDTGNHELNGELDLNGPATWTAGNIGVGGGTIVNNATFTATAATSQTLQMFGNGAGVNAFNNQAGGSFIVNGPGTVRVFFLNSALPFNNAGSVSVQSGILHLESASSHSGDFDGQAGATLLFLGNQTFAASSHINGNLNLEIDSGTDTYPNGLNTTGTVTFRGGSFTIGGNVSGGTLAFTGGTGVLNGAVNSTNSLSITGGKFVLGGALTTHYGGAPFLTPTVRGYLLSSALAPAVIGGSLGYADGADGIVAGLNAGDFLIKPAVPGDADLNGKVGFPDLVLLARHYGQSNVGWDVGDFNYDGKVGFDDLVILARHYGKVGPTAAAASFQAGVIATTPLITLPSHRRRIPGSV